MKNYRKYLLEEYDSEQRFIALHDTLRKKAFISMASFIGLLIILTYLLFFYLGLELNKNVIFFCVFVLIGAVRMIYESNTTLNSTTKMIFYLDKLLKITKYYYLIIIFNILALIIAIQYRTVIFFILIGLIIILMVLSNGFNLYLKKNNDKIRGMILFIQGKQQMQTNN